MRSIAMGLPGTLVAALVVAIGSWPRDALANERVYTVAKYPVEASAKDASTARQKALEDGQKAAFRSLLKRLVPVTSFNRIGELKKEKVGDLVTSYAVRSERNSDTDYVGSLDFTFQPEGVRALLQRQGIPFVEEQAPATVLVPAYVAPAAAAGKSASNATSAANGTAAWNQAWQSIDTENALAVLDVQKLKAQIHADAIRGLAGGTTSHVRILAQEYQSERVVMAIAEPDPAAGKLTVVLVGQDGVGPLYLRKTYRLEGGDLGYATELAAVVSLGILEGRWKAQRLPGRTAAFGPRPGFDVDPDRPPNPWMAQPQPAPPWQPGPPPAAGGFQQHGEDGEVIHIAVEFRGMAEWQQISRELSNTPGVQDLDVQGLSGRGARVILRYPGGPAALSRVLFGQGLVMRNAGRVWMLQMR